LGLDVEGRSSEIAAPQSGMRRQQPCPGSS
jgi:hypothetical protein